MRIGIVGVGKLGLALALALKEKGCQITGAYSRNPASIELLNSKLGTHLNNDLGFTVQNADVIFITTPDTAIQSTAEEIGGQLNECALAGKCFFHCSGALTSDVLTVLEGKGALTASLHPVQTFADRENGWKGLKGIYFGYEGCDGLTGKAQEIVALLGSHMLYVKKDAKSLYHAAACILSNYMVTLSYIAEEVLSHAGIGNDKVGIKPFLPLMEKTLENIGRMGPTGALTGPVSRGDGSVVRRHLEALDKLNPENSDYYRLLGVKTMEMAMKKGIIDEEKRDLLIDALKE